MSASSSVNTPVILVHSRTTYLNNLSEAEQPFCTTCRLFVMKSNSHFSYNDIYDGIVVEDFMNGR